MAFNDQIAGDTPAATGAPNSDESGAGAQHVASGGACATSEVSMHRNRLMMSGEPQLSTINAARTLPEMIVEFRAIGTIVRTYWITLSNFTAR